MEGVGIISETDVGIEWKRQGSIGAISVETVCELRENETFTHDNNYYYK